MKKVLYVAILVVLVVCVVGLLLDYCGHGRGVMIGGINVNEQYSIDVLIIMSNSSAGSEVKEKVGNVRSLINHIIEKEGIGRMGKQEFLKNHDRIREMIKESLDERITKGKAAEIEMYIREAGS